MIFRFLFDLPFYLDVLAERPLHAIFGLIIFKEIHL